MLPTFELSRPADLDEAVRELAAGGVPYVGGTELVAAMNIGLLAPPHLVDLKRIGVLEGIRVDGDRLTIGATTRHRDVAVADEVRTHAPVLAAACSKLGNARVRTTGSIGGNICFADPRSDVTTALFALQARVSLYSGDRSRTVPIDEFVLGAMESDCGEGELVTAIDVPLADRYHVYLRHQPTEYPTVCIAMSVERSDPGGPVRIVVGAVGERPQTYTAGSLDAIDLDAILPGLDVIEDMNGSEPYKRHLVGVFVDRAASGLREVIDA